MSTYEPDSDFFPKLIPGLKLFNSGHYWECHEILEDPWMEYRGMLEQDIYWGIIQGAAVLVHVEKSNIQGAHGLLKKAKEKIIRCRGKVLDRYLLENWPSWRPFCECLMAISHDAALEEFQDLLKFKFSWPKEKE